MAKATAKRSFFSKKLIFTVLNVAVLAGLAAFGAIYFNKYNDIKNMTPDQIQQAQTDRYISEINELYSLPKDEKPDVATVKDKEALKQQYPFFDQAENDDVVVIYKEAKLAILYRPAEKKLVKVGPVNVESGVSIRTVGSDAERKTVEQVLTDNKLNFTSGGAAKTTLSGITVVDVKGDKEEQAKNLATVVKGTVGSLPEGEDQPSDVDLLILVGPAAVTPVEVIP
jgi:uncharacterized protein YnzC (UPF0291/DUF896 family)